MFSFLFKVLPLVFGSSNNGRSLADGAANVMDRFFPSAETKEKLAKIASEAGDTSQKLAGERKELSHESWFDILIDGFNRLPRPCMAFWALGVLAGWWQPAILAGYDPLILQILWTIVAFYFGARTLSKDIIPAIMKYQSKSKKRKVKKVKANAPMEVVYEDEEDDGTW